MKTMKNKLISLKSHLSSSDSIIHLFNDVLDMINDILELTDTSYGYINECKNQLTRRDKALQILKISATQKRNDSNPMATADFSLTALSEQSNPVSLYLSLNSTAWNLIFNCTSAIQIATRLLFVQASWNNAQPFLKLSNKRSFKIEVDPTSFFTVFIINIIRRFQYHYINQLRLF